MQIKAVGLLSGGLDSTLACAIMKREGIDVIGLNCSTGFCLTDHRRKIQRKKDKDKDLSNSALIAAAQIKIPIEIVDISKEYLQVVFNPKYGYGKAVNPCIDCRILMLKVAKKFAEEHNAQFVFTGEVLGQRPMSQHKPTLKLIEKESGLEGYLLRPLSAKLLDETIPEKNGWVKRANLYAIQGRSRKTQMQLAHQFGISKYPSPAGGCCVLVDKNYANKFKDLIKHKDKAAINFEDLILLKIGRHFRLAPDLKIIVGREEAENNFILQHAKNKHIFKVKDFPGAIILADGNVDSIKEKIISKIAAFYSDAKSSDSVTIMHYFNNQVNTIKASPIREDELNKWRI